LRPLRSFEPEQLRFQRALIVAMAEKMQPALRDMDSTGVQNRRAPPTAENQPCSRSRADWRCRRGNAHLPRRRSLQAPTKSAHKAHRIAAITRLESRRSLARRWPWLESARQGRSSGGQVALAELRAEAETLANTLLAHIAPPGWEHIKLQWRPRLAISTAQGVGPCEIREQPSSMPPSVGFGTDAMDPSCVDKTRKLVRRYDRR